VINTNLPRNLHRFRNIVFDWSKIAIFNRSPRWRSSPGTISVKLSVDVNGWPGYQMA